MKKCLNCEKELTGKQAKYCSHLCECRCYEKKNKEKIDEYRREYRKKHSKKNIKYQKEYRKEKGDILLEEKKEYYKKNKKAILKTKAKYKRKRRKEDPLFRMGGNLSSCMTASLKCRGLRKNRRHWEDLVGYKVYELKDHLERLFKPGMSWDNYGYYGWHIDHIIPRSFFKYKSVEDVEFKYCWSLDNIQPLWASENKKKSDRIVKNMLKSDCVSLINRI